MSFSFVTIDVKHPVLEYSKLVYDFTICLCQSTVLFLDISLPQHDSVAQVFLDAPRISIRGCVRWSVGPLVRRSIGPLVILS